MKVECRAKYPHFYKDLEYRSHATRFWDVVLEDLILSERERQFTIASSALIAGIQAPDAIKKGLDILKEGLFPKDKEEKPKGMDPKHIKKVLAALEKEGPRKVIEISEKEALQMAMSGDEYSAKQFMDLISKSKS